MMGLDARILELEAELAAAKVERDLAETRLMAAIGKGLIAMAGGSPDLQGVCLRIIQEYIDPGERQEALGWLDRVFGREPRVSLLVRFPQDPGKEVASTLESMGFAWENAASGWMGTGGIEECLALFNPHGGVVSRCPHGHPLETGTTKRPLSGGRRPS